jgi:hypothetical protein
MQCAAAPDSPSIKHLPRLAVRAAPDAAQLPADFEQQIGEAQLTQCLDAVVDSEALGDAREVERDAARLQQGAFASSNASRCQPATRTRRGKCFGRGQAALLCVRPESPAGDQRTDGRIDRARAGARPVKGAGHHFGEFLGQHMTRARGRAVEPADVRRRLPVAHLRDHARKRRFDRLSHLSSGSIRGLSKRSDQVVPIVCPPNCCRVAGSARRGTAALA